MKINSEWELKLQEELLEVLKRNGHKWADQNALAKRKAEIIKAIREYKEAHNEV